MSKQLLPTNMAEERAHAQPRVSKNALPASAVHNYIHDMLIELEQLAKGAKLRELEALLKLTVTACEMNKRVL